MVATRQPAPWRHAALAYTGLLHEHEALPCQDAWRVLQRDGITAACVSDGAGSAPLSQHGSRLIADATCEFLCDQFDVLHAQDDIRQRKALFDHLRPQLEALAAAQGRPVCDFAATLLCLALHTDGRWLAFHTGDGLLLARAGGQLFSLSLPDHGEYCNETRFVTSPTAPRHTRVQRGNGFFMGHRVDGFILCTDGIENMLATVHTGKVAPLGYRLLEWLDQAGAETAAARLARQTPLFRDLNTDDGTLVLLSGLAEGPCGAPAESRLPAPPAGAGQTPCFPVQNASAEPATPHFRGLPWLAAAAGCFAGLLAGLALGYSAAPQATAPAKPAPAAGNPAPAARFPYSESLCTALEGPPGPTTDIERSTHDNEPPPEAE